MCWHDGNVFSLFILFIYSAQRALYLCKCPCKIAEREPGWKMTTPGCCIFHLQGLGDVCRCKTILLFCLSSGMMQVIYFVIPDKTREKQVIWYRFFFVNRVEFDKPYNVYTVACPYKQRNGTMWSKAHLQCGEIFRYQKLINWCALDKQNYFLSYLGDSSSSDTINVLQNDLEDCFNTNTTWSYH